jgi:hypoxanthine phosphoribosyltransferase
MIDYDKLTDIDLNSTEGKLLMAALAILTTIDYKHIASGNWGTSITPDTAVKQITELANKIYQEEEWKAEQQRIIRDNNINKILRNEQ